MLKTIGSIEFLAEPRKIKTRVDSNSIVGGGKITNHISFTKKKYKQKQLSPKF